MKQSVVFRYSCVVALIFHLAVPVTHAKVACGGWFAWLFGGKPVSLAARRPLREGVEAALPKWGRLEPYFSDGHLYDSFSHRPPAESTRPTLADEKGALVFDEQSFAGLRLFPQAPRPGALMNDLSPVQWAQFTRALFARTVGAPGGKVATVVGKDARWGDVHFVRDPKTKAIGYAYAEAKDRHARIVDYFLPTPLDVHVLGSDWKSRPIDTLVVRVDLTNPERPLVREVRGLVDEPGAASPGAVRERLRESVAKPIRAVRFVTARDALIEAKEEWRRIYLWHNPWATTESLVGLRERVMEKRNADADGAGAGAGAVMAIVGAFGAGLLGHGTPKEAYSVAILVSTFAGAALGYPVGHLFARTPAPLRAVEAKIAGLEREIAILRAEGATNLDLPQPPGPKPRPTRAELAAPITGRDEAAARRDIGIASPELVGFLRGLDGELASPEERRYRELFQRAEAVGLPSDGRGTLVKVLQTALANSGPPEASATFASPHYRAYETADRWLTDWARTSGRTVEPLSLLDIYRRTRGPR